MPDEIKSDEGLVVEKKIPLMMIVALVAYGAAFVYSWATMTSQAGATAALAEKNSQTIAALQSQLSNMGTINYRLDQMDAKMTRIENKLDDR